MRSNPTNIHIKVVLLAERVVSVQKETLCLDLHPFLSSLAGPFLSKGGFTELIKMLVKIFSKGFSD